MGIVSGDCVEFYHKAAYMACSCCDEVARKDESYGAPNEWMPFDTHSQGFLHNVNGSYYHCEACSSIDGWNLIKVVYLKGMLRHADVCSADRALWGPREKVSQSASDAIYGFGHPILMTIEEDIPTKDLGRLALAAQTLLARSGTETRLLANGINEIIKSINDAACKLMRYTARHLELPKDDAKLAIHWNVFHLRL